MCEAMVGSRVIQSQGEVGGIRGQDGEVPGRFSRSIGSRPWGEGRCSIRLWEAWVDYRRACNTVSGSWLHGIKLESNLKFRWAALTGSTTTTLRIVVLGRRFEKLHS